MHIYVHNETGVVIVILVFEDKVVRHQLEIPGLLHYTGFWAQYRTCLLYTSRCV